MTYGVVHASLALLQVGIGRPVGSLLRTDHGRRGGAVRALVCFCLCSPLFLCLCLCLCLCLTPPSDLHVSIYPTCYPGPSSLSWSPVSLSLQSHSRVSVAPANKVVSTCSCGNEQGILHCLSCSPHSQVTAWTTPGPRAPAPIPHSRVTISSKTRVCMSRPRQAVTWHGVARPYLSILAA